MCVPLLAQERVVGALNVYRVGADRAFTDAEVELVERFATMAALAYDSARQRETLREQVRTDGLTGLLNHRALPGAPAARARAALPAGRTRRRRRLIDLDHFKVHQRRPRPRRGRPGARRRRRPAALASSARATPSAASAARSSC